MKNRNWIFGCGSIVAFLLPMACAGQSTTPWPAYNGGLDGDHYSPLKQINRANVQQLKFAWTYDTGEKGGIQTNPLMIGRTLYAFTPTQKVVALDAASGTMKWTFDSGIKGPSRPVDSPIGPTASRASSLPES